jgi:hypothetical protein
MTMPENAFKLVDIQGRMTPIVGEQGKLRAGDAPNLAGKQLEFLFEANCPAEDHKSLTMSSMDP